ncbi:hypothetical protein GCM10022226_46990 [Sphaerisporangium flaviroseum]|uniref:Uncharacterized protein n=1 Tax=Sphaerisporangium flaviroseum TaxID=509199 RepID=A0ABP7ILJ5_9ACTN
MGYVRQHDEEQALRQRDEVAYAVNGGHQAQQQDRRPWIGAKTAATKRATHSEQTGSYRREVTTP